MKILKRFEFGMLTLFRPGGSLGTPQKFMSITLRAFEIIFLNLVTFPKIYWEIW